MKTYIIDGYDTCANCGYTIRRGWLLNDETSQGLICGRCCEECGLEPTARAIAEND